MYQRSTSFDVGVFTDDFSLGLSYHKDVEEVYKSITATGQAVGNFILLVKLAAFPIGIPTELF